MSVTEEKGYEDIIRLPHHVSMIHPHMSLQDRAAQFSPFAALTGHSDALKETERLNLERIIQEETGEKDIEYFELQD